MNNISLPTNLSDEDFEKEFSKFFNGQWDEASAEMLNPCIELFQHGGPSIFEKIKEKARARGLNPDDFIERV